MKFSLFFLLVIGLQVSATVHSQARRFNFEIKNEKVAGVLKQIESTSNFRFFFQREQVDVNRQIDLTASDNTVEDILDKLFEDQNITYKVLEDNLILLIPAAYKIGWEQQQLTVTGRVTDASTGQAMPGVNIVIKGTTTGAISDSDGKYTLSVTDRSAILVFSFIGYTSQEIALNGRTAIDVTMSGEVTGLEEVVVIGYGTRNKKDLTGAISSINSEELLNEVKMTPELAMQGKMTGVLISNPGSNPLSRPTIRIRGISTLGFNDPLYVIDGIPIYEYFASSTGGREGDLRGAVNIVTLINPNDIESISVLKDASATAIYGVRASNGVILISTKRGGKGKPKVSLTANYGIQNIVKRYDLLSTKEYVDLWNEAWINNTSTNPPSTSQRFFDSSSPHYLGDSPTYNWQEESFVRNAPIEDYNISISGGNEVTNYAVGSGYARQEDALFTSSFKRYSLFANSDHKIGDWLKVGESFRFAYTQNSPNNSVVSAYGPPWQPIFDENDPLGYARPGRVIDGVFVPAGYGPGTVNNSLAINRNQYYEMPMLRNMGNIYTEISPIKGLRFRGTFSFDWYQTDFEQWFAKLDPLYISTEGKESIYAGRYYQRLNYNTNLVSEFLIGYNKSFGKHNIDGMLNAMNQKIMYKITSTGVVKNSPIESWERRRVDEGWLAEDKVYFYRRENTGLMGYMGRLSYNYSSKYYLDATIRRDGTSKFGPGYKWGTFPSLAVAWRISSESFMQSVGWIDDIKIRIGWGKSGNQETQEWAYMSLVNMNPKYGLGTVGVGDGIVTAAAVLGDFPVADMSWETVTSSNFGIDATLLNNKLILTAEYYHRVTDGILQQVEIPLVIGVLNKPYMNLAKVSNKGFEFQVNYSDNIGNIGYNISCNLTTNNNNVDKLYLSRPQTSGNYRTEEGYPIGYIYGYKMGGIFQSDQEVTEYKNQYTDPGYDDQKSPGDIYYKDLYGPPAADAVNVDKSYEPDGQISSYDRTYLGKTIPGYFYGISAGLDYKNWDLSITFRGVGDVQKINTTRMSGEAMTVIQGSNSLSTVLDRWTPSNPSTTMPRAVAGDPTGNNRVSDRWVEDAGFFRMQNFQLGYNFGSSITNKIGLSGLRCYLTGSNLFVLSPYSGLDPENDTTPMVFALGVNLNF